MKKAPPNPKKKNATNKKNKKKHERESSLAKPILNSFERDVQLLFKALIRNLITRLVIRKFPIRL